MSLQNYDYVNILNKKPTKVHDYYRYTNDKGMDKCVNMSINFPSIQDSKSNLNYSYYHNAIKNSDEFEIQQIQDEMKEAKRMLKYISKMYRWIGSKLAFFQKSRSATYDELRESTTPQANVVQGQYWDSEKVENESISVLPGNMPKLSQKVSGTNVDDFETAILYPDQHVETNHCKIYQSDIGLEIASEYVSVNQDQKKSSNANKKRKKKTKIKEFAEKERIEKENYIAQMEFKLDKYESLIEIQILTIKKWFKDFILSEEEVQKVVKEVNEEDHMGWEEMGDMLSTQLQWINYEKMGLPGVDFDPILWKYDSEARTDEWVKNNKLKII